MEEHILYVCEVVYNKCIYVVYTTDTPHTKQWLIHHTCTCMYTLHTHHTTHTTPTPHTYVHPPHPLPSPILQRTPRWQIRTLQIGFLSGTGGRQDEGAGQGMEFGPQVSSPLRILLQTYLFSCHTYHDQWLKTFIKSKQTETLCWCTNSSFSLDS